MNWTVVSSRELDPGGCWLPSRLLDRCQDCGRCLTKWSRKLSLCSYSSRDDHKDSVERGARRILEARLSAQKVEAERIRSATEELLLQLERRIQ